ncbi:MAG: serine protease [Trichoglossum hirsutum]|nr:MAG: serine protease [Trichoglossum hirsutum]
MRSLLTLSLSLLASATPIVLVDTIHNGAAPILSASSYSKEIPDSYIVVFKKHVTTNTALEHHGWVQDIHFNTESAKSELRKRSQSSLKTDLFEGLKHTYNIAGGFLGYSGHFDEEVIEQVRRHPDVEYIEKDSEVHTMSDNDAMLEKNAPWGLARVSHRDALSFSNFNKYLYAADGGDGVDVYIVDTGTNIEHVDFEGRASWGKTIPLNDEDLDGNGHGTHCSGTVAGKKYGVAKKANIIAIKVLRSNGSGTMSDVVKGVEYAAESHAKRVEDAKKGKGKKGFKGSAANMSLGGGKSVTLDRAVNAAVDAGLHFAVAAGNDNSDSCNYSPAAASKAVTVGASTLGDERAYFSNFGKCNDIFAPGLNIQSCWIGSKWAVNTISGTSMASPHVAGLLAYFLSLQPSKDSAFAVEEITPEKLKKNLIAIGTPGRLSDVPSNTANILAWNGGGSSNYTKIINEGNEYVTGPAIPKSRIVIDLEDSVSLKVAYGSEKLAKATEEVTERIEDFVDEQLRDFFKEVKKAMDA